MPIRESLCKNKVLFGLWCAAPLTLQLFEEENWSLFANIVFCVVAVGVPIYLWNFDRTQKDDITDAIFEKKVMEATRQLLPVEAPGTVRKIMDGQDWIITDDCEVMKYVFEGRNKKNFIHRPASDEGLKQLFMLSQGLIWNNDTATWNRVRKCIQSMLTADFLKQADEIAFEQCTQLVAAELQNSGGSSSSSSSADIDFLKIARQTTFRVSLQLFFGVKPVDFERYGIDEPRFIEAICDYFKAWEFFFLRTRKRFSRDAAALCQHQQSIAALRKCIASLVDQVQQDSSSSSSSSDTTTTPFLLNRLQEEFAENQEMLKHCCLEMMLAGTDTSSVTAFYSLLGVAETCELQSELRSAIRAAESNRQPLLLAAVVNEALRFKPVGPVVLRRAVEADEHFPTGRISKGAAVVVHLQSMNMRQQYWGKDAHEFRPQRFLNSEAKRCFAPFGEGPKGCVGKFLGLREAKAVVRAVVSSYQLSIRSGDNLEKLETNWDIANQPSNPTKINVVRI